MKNLTQVLFALFCLCMPALLHAQRDDSKYLAGAVPEADGKVVFTKDFSIPGMSQDTIYSRLLKWMDTRLAKNENTSRVVYSDRGKGQIVGMGDEWIVFTGQNQNTLPAHPHLPAGEMYPRSRKNPFQLSRGKGKIYRRGMDYRQIRFEQVQDQTGTRPCQMAQKDGGLR